MTGELPEYSYRGARALVILQEQKLREFVAVWKQARDSKLIIPVSEDEDYVSLKALLRHLLRASRGYITWSCEMLGLDNPGIESTPEAGDIESKLNDYLEHLLERWRSPLAGVSSQRFLAPLYKSRWGVEYCIEAMLEHSVTHPMRHTLQLREWMGRPPIA